MADDRRRWSPRSTLALALAVSSALWLVIITIAAAH